MKRLYDETSSDSDLEETIDVGREEYYWWVTSYLLSRSAILSLQPDPISFFVRSVRDWNLQNNLISCRIDINLWEV